MRTHDSGGAATRSRRTVLKWSGGAVAMLAVSGGFLPNFGITPALADKAIPGLDVDFSKIDFTSRESVLTTAKTFEDLGVSAYNGAGKLIKNPDYLIAAGKIVSVEARHAATLRDLLQPGSTAFAGSDVVDKNGLDVARTPAAVLKAAGPFIKTEITANQIEGMN